MAESFDDFEFKPLTEGLGFHKKAEKIKVDVQSPQISREVSRETAREVSTTSRVAMEASPRKILQDGDALLEKAASQRVASQSISDLIASLPPSLDFLDSKPSDDERSMADLSREFGRVGQGSKSDISSTRNDLSSMTSSVEIEAEQSRPQIFQPLVREEFKADANAGLKTDFKSSQSTSLATSQGPTIGQVLPAAGAKASTTVSMPTPGAPAALKAGSAAAPTVTPSPYRERLDESFARAFPQHQRGRDADVTTKEEVSETDLQAIPAHFGAGILDGMVVAGFSTLLLVCILAVTRVNLMGLLMNAQTDLPTQVHLGLLFVACLQMYMLTARCFFEATLGEWAFDLQLGKRDQPMTAIFPLQVAWRTILMTITGFILIPVLSLIFRRDLAAWLTGLQLYRRN